MATQCISQVTHSGIGGRKVRNARSYTDPSSSPGTPTEEYKQKITSSTPVSANTLSEKNQVNHLKPQVHGIAIILLSSLFSQ